MKKVLVGMSGGVDSSVAAALLLEQGYEVSGVFIEAYNEPGCRSDQDKKDALQVALRLGIPFEVLDYRSEYKEKVVQYFVDEYKEGRTPNPDIVCNREVKFGLLYDYMMANGFDYLATGHYARIVRITEHVTRNTYLLQKPMDLSKDQTYFLWQVAQDKLEHILFPLGEMLKSEVRARARELGLPNAEKPDSMGVCMIGELNVGEFLKEKLGEKEGGVVMIAKSQKFQSSPTIAQRSELQKQGSELCKVGTHRGLWFYTVGQRVGREITTQISKIKSQNQKLKFETIGMDMTNLPALYVVGKNIEKNELVIGERGEVCREKFCIMYFVLSIMQDKFEELLRERKMFVRIRNLGEMLSVNTIDRHNTKYIIHTSDHVFAPAPGQSAVFYTEMGIVAGGGIIGDS